METYFRAHFDSSPFVPYIYGEITEVFISNFGLDASAIHCPSFFHRFGIYVDIGGFFLTTEQ
jgi:hypothetical protein